ncbi:Hypp2132 [Branchiostoma lanceolatum]|uniref:Hypp2132 protein n=1 Tax=Branchiostoma lanceolatum TaxID=7740 RepID=A0A8J9ZT37_BRALA|nr:Hypp2132 [Branchiostoma lanceolatum]
MKNLRILLIAIVIVATVVSQCSCQSTAGGTNAPATTATAAPGVTGATTQSSGSAVIHASLGMFFAAALMALLH